MELDHLKDIAAELKYEHHHNIGVEKLEKQLLEYCITQGTTLEEVSATVLAKKIKVDPTVMEDPKQELIEKLSKNQHIPFAISKIINTFANRNIGSLLCEVTYVE